MPDDPAPLYHLIINHNKQYSLWAVGRPDLPFGWTQVGDKQWTEAEGVAWIDQQAADAERTPEEVREDEERERAAAEKRGG